MFYSQRWSLFLVLSLLALPVAPAHKAHAQSLTVDNLDQPTQPTVTNLPSGVKDSNGSVVEIDNSLQITSLAPSPMNSWLSQEEITQDSEQLDFSPSMWLNSNPLWSSNTSLQNQEVNSEIPDEGEICEESLVEIGCEFPEAPLDLSGLILPESAELEEVETGSKTSPVTISQGFSETEMSPEQVSTISSFSPNLSMEAIPEPSISFLTWFGLSAVGLWQTSRKLRK